MYIKSSVPSQVVQIYMYIKKLKATQSSKNFTLCIAPKKKSILQLKNAQLICSVKQPICFIELELQINHDLKNLESQNKRINTQSWETSR